MRKDKMNLQTRVEKTFKDLFPLNRSLTGKGVEATFKYLKKHFLAKAELKSLKSGTKVH